MVVKKNELVFILASSTVVVFAWIGFSIYHSTVSSTVSPSAAIQINPITPNFDTQTIAELKNRKRIAPLLEATTPLQTTKDTSQQESSPAAKPSTKLTPTPTALPKALGR